MCPLDRHVRIRDCFALEKALDELHALKYLLFLETSPNDLHADREGRAYPSRHSTCTYRIRSCSAVESAEVQIHRERESAVHARDRHDARGVVELCYKHHQH